MYLVIKPSLASIQQRLKITVLGKGLVGKSSLSYCFVNSKVLKNRDATIEDRYIIAVDVDNIPCEIGIKNEVIIEILDTAGQDDYQNLIDGWINFGDGYLIVFALNDKDTLGFAESRRERIIKMRKSDDVPIVLVGNKKDLEEERVYNREDVEKVAQKWNCDYIETSAIVY
jgi:small GTP-binding protein